MNTISAWNQLLVAGLGLLGFVATTALASETERPVKELNQASDQIHWPDGFAPQQADSFVHNQIFIKAPAKIVWANLVTAKDWPSWYSNSAEVQVAESAEGQLGPKTRFTWKTFGFPVKSQVEEFVPDSRLAWFGDGTGIRAYHAWLIIEQVGGCEVITEETQKGPSAIAFNLAQPTAMYDGHSWWLSALKVRSERQAR
jgi:Polyketide cyclase / dehydrase and lipid transport